MTWDADDSEHHLVDPVLDWFAHHERPLPWRSTSPWGVLVSEFMLQQTPVVRVLPVWREWLERWPDPASLAEASMADALRAWGRLGYPRRARRLHEAATAIVERHEGQVPADEESLLSLPGVGAYTAAAVRAFAFGQRAIVLDVNVRRVLARAQRAAEHPTGHITSDERLAADHVWPHESERSARWSAAVMELGALVCTSRNPECDACPISTRCAWLDAGRPEAQRLRRQPAFEGSDRQVRGLIMAHLRNSQASVTATAIDGLWDNPAQRARALDGLLADGLVERTRNGRYRLATGT